MSLGFEIPTVQMEPPSFRKDKSVKIAFTTGEMNAEQKMAVLNNEGSLGTLVFVPEDVEGQPPKIDVDIETKSLSERLRNVQFVWWKDHNEPQGNFNVWRAKEMERLIQKYKDTINN